MRRRRLAAFPHELSGGMQQRVMIAIALACNPELLLADEPTSALDVTIQAQIMQLILSQVRARDASCIFVLHDLALASQACDRIVVLYAGQVVEAGPTESVLRPFAASIYQRAQVLRDRARHRDADAAGRRPSGDRGHAGGLPVRAAVPARRPPVRSPDTAASFTGGPRHRLLASGMSDAAPIFRLLDVEKVYQIDRGGWSRLARRPPRRLAALDGVRLTVRAGDSIALVGESGSGKSTLLRVLLGLTESSDGRALYRGDDIETLTDDKRRSFQRDVAMIYQDARASLNPRLKALDLIGEPIRQHALCPESELRERVAALLARVGMPADTADRYPGQLSGGQVRRVAIARALASQPKVIVADEAVSGLDVSTQAQLLNLLRGLQHEMGLTLMFITHDLAVASYLCSRIAVMYLGRIVEAGPTKEVLRRPLHPYTRALLNASPRFFEPIAETLPGEIPSPIDLPPGCRFASRCSRAALDCRAQEPPLATMHTNREAACLHPLID